MKEILVKYCNDYANAQVSLIERLYSLFFNMLWPIREFMNNTINWLILRWLLSYFRILFTKFRTLWEFLIYEIPPIQSKVMNDIINSLIFYVFDGFIIFFLSSKNSGFLAFHRNHPWDPLYGAKYELFCFICLAYIILLWSLPFIIHIDLLYCVY